jgi:hypothetical protein
VGEATRGAASEKSERVGEATREAPATRSTRREENQRADEPAGIEEES